MNNPKDPQIRAEFMPFIPDQPDLSDLSIEEAGGFEPVDETLSTADGGWKDELNLAEFPIAALTDRIPNGQTTLVFEDKLERKDHPPIVRRLTIMGTAKHGLPTSTDDEILVGLIQLTKRRSNFTNAKVPFSRYELIELLGWPQSGASYRRIEEALHRWVGVVLMYENAWWDNTEKSWVDENFHVLDNVTLYDRERRKRASKNSKTTPKTTTGKRIKKVGTEGDPLPLSSFRWNEVIFESFQSGNLKQLDLEFYLKLRLPTTKRMFRFLDKRFYRRERLDFDLKTLACEHIGMSRSYAPTELKRRLKPALEELEQLGFLEPLSLEERYSWVAKGSWRILLIRAQSQSSSEVQPPERVLLLEVLVARGVSSRVATDLIAEHPPGRIRTKVEVFDWLVKNQDKRVGKNPSGFLVASIKADYGTPEDFAPAAKAEQTRKKADETIRSAKKKAVDQHEHQKQQESELRARWDQLSEQERDAIKLAVRAANPGLGRWKNMLEPLCLAALDNPPPPVHLQKSLFPVEAD